MDLGVEDCPNLLLHKRYFLKKLGPAVVTVTDCRAEILQYSSGIGESLCDGIYVFCLVEFFISTGLDAHVD